jgi:hypothetical protein
MAIKYSASTSLHKWDTLEKRKAGDPQMFGSQQVWNGTLKGCVLQFLRKPKGQRAFFEITVGEDAGVGKVVLGPDDILTIAEGEDFPRD